VLVRGSGHAEESQHGALAGVELGLEDLDGSPVLVEVMAGEVGEDVQDAGRTGGGAVSVFGVEGESGGARGGHGGADLALDEGVDEQGQEVTAQQALDAGRAVEVNGGHRLGAFEAVVAALQVGLVAVGGQDLGRGEPGVVGDQRPAPVGGGSPANGVGTGFPRELDGVSGLTI
jgi:hypothetical protein